MKNCKEIKKLLSAYADGELTDTEKQVVEQHVAACPDCKALLAEQLKLNERLQSMKETPPAPDIENPLVSTITNPAVRKPHPWLRPVLIATPIVVVAAVLATILPPMFSLTPEKVLAKASAALANVNSYRCVSDSYSSDRFDPNATNYSYNEHYKIEVAGDRLHVIAQYLTSDYAYEQITIDNQNYATGDTSFPFTLEQTQEFAPSVINTLQRLDMLVTIAKLPDETIDGVACSHYSGTVDMEEFALQMQQTMEIIYQKLGQEYSEWTRRNTLYYWHNQKITYELWVGKNDYLIRQWKQIIQPGPKTISSHAGSISVIKYSDFNAHITIEPPLDKDGNLLSGWSNITGAVVHEVNGKYYYVIESNSYEIK